DGTVKRVAVTCSFTFLCHCCSVRPRLLDDKYSFSLSLVNTGNVSTHLKMHSGVSLFIFIWCYVLASRRNLRLDGRSAQDPIFANFHVYSIIN
ncbi:hypothetical protein MAR_003304, partial [Mya arenaria]